MKTLTIPERFTGTVYIKMWSNPQSCLYGVLYVDDIYLTRGDPSESTESILLGKVDVDIPLDANGTVDKQVDQLRNARQQIIDKATAEAQQIEEAIESLLAIEYKGDPE
jgi:hypothetical protein